MSSAHASGFRAASAALELPQPYLLFLGDLTEPMFAKTAAGLRDWAPERCVGEHTAAGGTLTLGLPQLTPAQARAAGACSMVIGVASIGGQIRAAWMPSLLGALEAGLDIVSGMHERLEDTPQLKAAAARLGRRLIDVRIPPPNIPIGDGRKRTGKRLLAVGTDCAVGKKYTALAIARGMRARGIDADFRATGQTGIMIAGGGMPMDAVVVDFEAGAAEILSPDAPADHWDAIEGQGSLFHPSYAAVALGLLHGSQPDVIVVCHELGRERVVGHADFALPSLEETIAVNLLLGRRTNPRIRCGGVSLNTARVSDSEARKALEREAQRLSLPVADPVRGGAEFEQLLDSCLKSD
jgi:uncharacterized NAD-dependent epimerase/dehydratase family protein